MKLFRFDDMVIKIRVEKIHQQKISSRTPQIQFLQSHKSDVGKEMGAIRQMCVWLREEADLVPTRVWDLMAGCGFSSRIFRKHAKGTKIIANDLDRTCSEILLENFSDDMTVYNHDIFHLPWDTLPSPGLVFIDFNTFTLQSIDFWNTMFKVVFRGEAPVAIVDSASYGFKFGNLEKYYNVVEPVDYYRLLDCEFRKRYNRRVRAIFPFGAACVVLTVPVKGRSRSIDIRPSSPVEITMTEIPDEGGMGLI